MSSFGNMGPIAKSKLPRKLGYHENEEELTILPFKKKKNTTENLRGEEPKGRRKASNLTRQGELIAVNQ